MKTRLQSSSASMVKNVSGRRRDFLMKNLRQIFQNEGPKGFFKGLPAVLIGTIPSRAIYFYSYNQAKRIRGDNSPVTHIISVSSKCLAENWFFRRPYQQAHLKFCVPRRFGWFGPSSSWILQSRAILLSVVLPTFTKQMEFSVSGAGSAHP